MHVQMWMSARPSLASVKAEIVSTLLDRLNVNAPLGTSSTRSRRNVKVSNSEAMNCLIFGVSLNDRVDFRIFFKSVKVETVKSHIRQDVVNFTSVVVV